jgi:hypothetical protein
MEKVFKQRKKLFIVVFVPTLLAVIYFFFNLTAHRKQVNDQENKRSISQGIVDKCMHLSNSSSCYSEELSVVVYKKSLLDAIEALNNIQEKDATTLYCHFIAHKITRTAVLKNPESWLNLFSEIDMAGCSNGYFHGILEGYLNVNPTFVLEASSIEKMCGRIQQAAKNKLEFGRTPGNCSHAIGHVLLVEKVGSIDGALSVCSTLRDDLRYSCFRGVFMEATEREALVMHEIASDLVWDEKNTLEVQKLCDKYDGEFHRACLQSLAPMYATISGADYKKLYEYCHNQKEEEDRELCFIEGVGYMAFLLAQDTINTAAHLPPLCSPLSSKAQAYRLCIRGVASYIINASPRLVDKLHAFCSDMDSEEETRFCYKEVTAQLFNIHGQYVFENFCDNARPQDRITCTDVNQSQN